MDIRKISWYLYPLAGFLLIFAFSQTRAFQFMEYRIFDQALRVLPVPAEDERILLLEIDDPSIAEAGTYPLGRDMIADGTVFFWENGTDYAVFDSDYIDISPRGVDERYLRDTMPYEVSSAVGEVESFGTGLVDAFLSGQIPPEAAADYLEQYREYSRSMEDRILERMDQVVMDKDAYFGERLALYGKGIISLGILDDVDPYVTDERREVGKPFALSPVEDRGCPVETASDIRPSITPISSRALALGFTRVDIDEDGVRRRINLLYRWKDFYFPQLGFALISELLQPESYILTDRSIILEGMTGPAAGERTFLTIPVDGEGKMLINWPHATFQESFRHLSFYKLIVHDIYADSLLRNLEQLESWGLLGMYKGDNPLDLLRYSQDYLEGALAGDDSADGEEYRSIRDAAYRAVADLASGDFETAALDEIDYYLGLPDFPESQKGALEDMRDALPLLMDNLEELSAEIMELRKEIHRSLSNSYVIMGYTGESTEDIGVTPFENQYMNMGLHGAVVNTVLQGDFLEESPFWMTAFLAFVLTGLITVMLRRSSPARSIFTASSLALISIAALLLFFRLTGIWPGFLMPLLSLFVTSLIVIIVKFVYENREKGFIKNAFGQYMSTEVINSILRDPSMLRLGGEEKELTAVFTDVKGFSTISEQLTPQQLVVLLNRYLTTFSDIILGHKGTIDKFEGDAIIAFFGAPANLEQHARAAVLSALDMKKAEKWLNVEFTGDSGLSPQPLLTRIGMNTGPMVVGNMGTTQKMDYTIMGNAVNLAARLEGVNKQYGTWTLCSHYTYDMVRDDVVARPLDKVRVVGIKEPVQLYELWEESALSTPEMREQLAFFERAMTLFNGRSWKEAEKVFREYESLFPDDKSASLYIKRCVQYQKNPPRENWDGVYNLTEK